MNLTKSQKTAVTFTGRNILVSAGAGTGKTRVLVERFLHFVISGQALVTEILALTYTEKAANEMKSRIMKKLGELGRERDRRDLESSYISTIHAFCARLLREHPFEAGVDPDFRVLESEESDFLKEQALDETLERLCEKGNEIFELLKVYTEKDVRAGILKVFDAARHDGKTLKEFFELSHSRMVLGGNPQAFGSPTKTFGDDKVSPLFEKLGEKELARECECFQKNENWDWNAVEDYKEWMAGFSRKRGKKGETSWAEIKGACAGLLAQRIDILMKPWARKFESLAHSFEGTYEMRKKEKGFLDFDDLQRVAVRLFEKQDKVSMKLLERCRGKFRHVMVDEFQDTNPLQLRLIELLSRGGNLFLVGDFKQSIYSFRGAEPALFLAKEKEYENEGRGLRVSLIENFRSAGPVLEFVNLFFGHLWQEDALPFEGLAGTVQATADNPGVELISVVKKEEESMDLARLREADLIAERMLELHEQGIAYGDIAVLFQVMTDIGLYEQALKKRGIPYYSLAGTGFYHQPEIRDMVSFLSFLENPLADIPLAAVLRSPLFQVSDNTLFWLSRQAKAEDVPPQATPLYEGVKQWEAIAQISADEKEKVRFFLEISRELLAVKDRLKLTELLDLILEKTSYELTVLADTQGVRRYANLKKMINVAREFESGEPLVLGAFLRTLRRLETHEVRESEAQVEAEESGRVVRLLSIHRSKGLEFKVVFVADLAREKRSDPAAWLKAEPGAGYSMEVWNEKTADWENPAGWIQLDENLNRKKRQEWKRQLYVAATRAKERLIFSGVHKEKKSVKENFSEMSSWMDWVMAMPPAVFEGVMIHPADGAGFLARPRALAEKKVFEEVFGDLNTHPLEEILPGAEERQRAEQEGAGIFAGLERKKRPSSRVIDLPVSAYAAFEKNPKKYRDIYEIGYPDEGEPERSEPAEAGDSYADFGTAVHKILEQLDFSARKGVEEPSGRNWAGLIQEACAGMTQEKREEAAEIVKSFCSTPVFERLQGARKVYRELPFVINQRHGRVEGVIDVLFQDGTGHWHVLDYKTSVGDAAKAKEAGYELQIGIYAFAASKILKITPKTGIVYFLKNQFAHVLELDGAALESVGVHLAGLQESILQFGNPSKNDMI
ncbi:MAG TPA: UvrD-helicase domain-containing protein [bacterium]|nr:UvrD-helicase domain-containing protein [bacterium]